MHWSDNYIGHDYVAGEYDCASLAETVARDVLGIAVMLPREHADTPFGRNAQIAAERGHLAESVADPIEGHPVLLAARGRLQHIGVMAKLAGEWWVLHADEGAGFVVRQRLRELGRHGYTVEGYYRWRT